MKSKKIEIEHYFSHRWNLRNTTQGDNMRVRVSWLEFFGMPLTKSQGNKHSEDSGPKLEKFFGSEKNTDFGRKDVLYERTEQWRLSEVISELVAFLDHDDFFQSADIMIGCEPFWLCPVLNAVRKVMVSTRANDQSTTTLRHDLHPPQLIAKLNMCPMFLYHGHVKDDDHVSIFSLYRDLLQDGTPLSSACRISAEMWGLQFRKEIPYVPFLGLHTQPAVYQRQEKDILVFRTFLPMIHTFLRVLNLFEEHFDSTHDVEERAEQDAQENQKSLQELQEGRTAADFENAERSSLLPKSEATYAEFLMLESTRKPGGGSSANEEEMDEMSTDHDDSDTHCPEVPQDELPGRRQKQRNSLGPTRIVDTDIALPRPRRKFVTMDSGRNLAYQEIANFAAVVLLPHVPNALRLSDMQAMHVPIFVPADPYIHKIVWPFAGPYCGRTSPEEIIRRIAQGGERYQLLVKNEVLSDKGNKKPTGMKQEGPTRPLSKDARESTDDTVRGAPSSSRASSSSSIRPDKLFDSDNFLPHHPYSPFDFQSTAELLFERFHHDRRYWLQFTEWAERGDLLLKFSSVRHLFFLGSSVSDRTLDRYSYKLRRDQERRKADAMNWWNYALRLVLE
ncbi:unnamed protein product [Amoebophrya sp. A120]|nr:unnamed protein product [Amoebophrya sp. A120]|eukprot:GSA120T00000671001.1